MSDTFCASANKNIPVATALFSALHAKHSPTAFHCLRVAQNLTAWGLYHGIGRELLSQVELLGLLHDIGKIGIPERILQKPDCLNEQERAIVAMHPSVGAKILSSSGLDESIVNSVARLGEWYDGSNVASRDEALPVHARLLAIADAFDAMITQQRYRPAMSLETALDELTRMAGRQFDPKILPTFIQTALACDNALQQDVEARWRQFGFGDNVADLFHQGDSLQAISVADNSLSSIFHRRLADHMNDGVIFIDTEYKILEWNRMAEAMTGCSRSSLTHQQWSPHIIKLQDEEGNDFTEDDCPLLAVIRGNGYNSRRLSLQHVDGTRRMVHVQVLPIHDDRGTCRGAAMIFDDITRQKNLEQAVQKLHIRATIDPLTKVHNRAELNLQMSDVEKDVKDGKYTACVIICDIDYFKRINDTYGHAAGDEALVSFASMLQSGSRETDLVSRYGGEEFVLLCRDCKLTDAVHKAELIRRKVMQQPLEALRGKCLNASFGVAEINRFPSAEAAINAADEALMRAKQNGRNRVEIASDEDHNLSIEAEPKKSENKASSWLSWLTASAGKQSEQFDIFLQLPSNLVIEKIRGFVVEWQIDLTANSEGTIMLKIDLRKAPGYARSTDHEVSFQMELKLHQVDYLPSDKRIAAIPGTMVSVQIAPTSRRDRRSSSTSELVQRIVKSFNRYLVGEILNEETRKCIHIHTRR